MHQYNTYYIQINTNTILVKLNKFTIFYIIHSSEKMHIYFVIQQISQICNNICLLGFNSSETIIYNNSNNLKREKATFQNFY